MENFFNINYEFDRKKVHQAIAEKVRRKEADYICVADGVIANTAYRTPEYLKVVNGGMFSICDSSFVPLYIKWLYGKRYQQYCGSQIFEDVIRSRKYRMIFIGTHQTILDSLRKNLILWNPAVADMKFVELPFRQVDQFNYHEIARIIEEDGADIIWLALGAPKQEIFMSMLKPHLNHGVMIAVGAAFKFFSGVDSSRAPAWMVRNHLEFVHRLYKEPRKQMKRCAWIIATLPQMLFNEWRNKNHKDHQSELLME